MRKIYYIVFIMLSLQSFAQKGLYKFIPFDYIWKNVGNEGFSAGKADYTCLAFSPSDQPYVAFQDQTKAQKATVMKFDGTSWVYVGYAGFSAGWISCPSLAFSQSGQPYVAYNDASNGGYWISVVRKFDGTNWVNVGNPGFSTGYLYSNSLAISPSGEPHVAYQDLGITNKITVMKYDGTNWVNVGIANFSNGLSQFITLAINQSGEPFVSYQDWLNSQKATVMKFDGINWVIVGTAGFSGHTTYTSLAFSQSGEPCVAFVDHENNFKVTVMKFNGTNWVNVGTAGFSAGEADYASLAYSLYGEPYVAYKDYVNEGKTTVMKFDGTNWVNVGLAGFSAGEADYISLAFSPSDNQPYVAYQDIWNSLKATVMKYDSVYVGINEPLESRLFIYPNPVFDKIIIEISTVSKSRNLAIVNMEGQELITRQIIEPKTQIDINNLPSGVYFLRLTNEKTVRMLKIIKQ